MPAARGAEARSASPEMHCVAPRISARLHGARRRWRSALCPALARGNALLVGGPRPAARQSLIEAASRLGYPDDLRVLAIQAYADPFGHAPAVLARVQRAATEGESDKDALLYLGPAAVAVGAFDVGNTLLAAATRGLRADGRLGHLAYVLAIPGLVAARLADWDVAYRLQSRPGPWRLSSTSPSGRRAGTSSVLRSQECAVMRTRPSRRWPKPSGSQPLRARTTSSPWPQCGRISAALGASRNGDAYAAAERLFDRADPAHYP